MLLVAENIQDDFGLSLDPVAGTYFLINATMVNIPKLTESMGRMRAAGTGVLSTGKLETVERAILMGQYSNINEFYMELTRNLEKAISADANIKAAVESRATEVKRQIDNVLVITNNQLLNAENLTFAADKYFDEYTSAINNIYAFNTIAIQSLVAALQLRVSDMQQSVYLLFGLMVLALGFGIFLSILIVRSITRPMNEAITIANAVASGDLTTRIEAKSNNETGRLLQALKQMNDNLIDLVGKVRSGTDLITEASEEIASGNLDLSQRTEQQSASLEQTASAMEELTSTVRQNADNAKQANQLAVGASDVAVKGGKVVGQVVQTMNEINESSKKIVDIISVIDSIAFQTNILALNAAVEAARAGEQGRGFAVVATEVRTLAQRSASAAKEIKELIKNSVSKVEDGTQLVDEAGTTMEEIVNAVKRVTDIMGEITAASLEQSQGIEQANQAISSMDTVTQQNAALVEEAAASAELMQEQSEDLIKAVMVFKLSGSARAPSAQRSKRKQPNANVTELPVQQRSKPQANDLNNSTSAQPRKAASGGDTSWEEF
ncbi:MAG: HAMP domain-containing protein [Burkholderiales bacterium]|nr:HAMP domain-containing protein [Nitrosomonas sp.]MCP5243925.1 HAMP domain-containing protein [Burkholderiales bacterium]